MLRVYAEAGPASEVVLKVDKDKGGVESNHGTMVFYIPCG